MNVADKMLLPIDSYTYLSPAWGTTSWLDHVVCTDDALQCIHNMVILHDCIFSDHFPLSFKFNVDVLPVCLDESNNMIKPRVNWNKLSLHDIERLASELAANSIA